MLHILFTTTFDANMMESAPRDPVGRRRLPKTTGLKAMGKKNPLSVWLESPSPIVASGLETKYQSEKIRKY